MLEGHDEHVLVEPRVAKADRTGEWAAQVAVNEQAVGEQAITTQLNRVGFWTPVAPPRVLPEPNPPPLPDPFGCATHP